MYMDLLVSVNACVRVGGPIKTLAIKYFTLIAAEFCELLQELCKSFGFN